MLGKTDVCCFNSKQSSEWALIVEVFSTTGLACVSWGAKNLKCLVLDLVLLAIYPVCTPGNVSENKKSIVEIRNILYFSLAEGRSEIQIINSSCRSSFSLAHCIEVGHLT